MFSRVVSSALFALLVGLAAPLHSQTVVSSPDGRRQVTAIPLTGNVAIDGVLDEEVTCNCRVIRPA